MRRAALLVLGLIGSFLVSACDLRTSQPETGGALLTRGHLVHAVERAGFHAEEVELALPVAVRSRVAVRTVDYDDRRLASLRERYQLRKRVEQARDEWSAQLMLRQWVHETIPSGPPGAAVERADDVLSRAARGTTFDCGFFTIVYVESAMALGWQARRIGVDRRHGPEGLGSTHHGVAEIWSNQFAKWVVIDSQSNLHFEKDGIPLSAWEIRAEWLRDGGAKVDHVVGMPPRAVKKNPAIIWWDRPDEDETATYFWLYIETDAFKGRPDARFRYIFPQDQHNRDLIWYQNSDSGRGQMHLGYRRGRFLPTWFLDDAYWTVGVVELAVAGASAGALHLKLDAYAPNRPRYEVAFDGKGWESIGFTTSLVWRLATGPNRLRLRSASPGEVKGPEAAVFLRLTRP